MHGCLFKLICFFNFRNQQNSLLDSNFFNDNRHFPASVYFFSPMVGFESHISGIGSNRWAGSACRHLSINTTTYGRAPTLPNLCRTCQVAKIQGELAHTVLLEEPSMHDDNKSLLFKYKKENRPPLKRDERILLKAKFVLVSSNETNRCQEYPAACQS